MKICSRCSKEKALSEFRKKSASPTGYSAWCKDCFATYDRERYASGDNERKKNNKRIFRERNQDLLWEYLLAHPCADCGESDPEVLEFDHRDDIEKVANISEMVWSHSWDNIMVEIEKCIVRCANCHRRRTNKQFGLWRSLRSIAQ